MRQNLIRLVKALAAALLLAGLYRAADWREVLRVAGDLDFFWLSAALLLFVPQTLVSALRWRSLVQPLRPLTVGESVRQTLAASALNLIVPSKLGDLSKAGMLGVAKPEQARAAALAVGEKIADVVALALFWAAGAWGILPALGAVAAALGWRRASYTRRRSAPSRERERTSIATSLARRARVQIDLSQILAAPWSELAWWSLLLWSLHLLQIGFFLRATGVAVAAGDTMARVPPAIFAGLLPLTLWGMGSRDAVLIRQFADLAPASTMAVVGMLTALRYVVPGAVGIVFVSRVFGRPSQERAARPDRPRTDSCLPAV